MYTESSAATINSGSLATDDWNTWAVPANWPVTLAGMRSCFTASSTSAVAWPIEVPGARLNDTVTAGNVPWWLMEIAVRERLLSASADSGTNVVGVVRFGATVVPLAATAVLPAGT